MNDKRLDTELAARLSEVPTLVPEDLTDPARRAALRSATAEEKTAAYGVTVRDVRADGVRLRITTPDGHTEPLPVLVEFHGGGFVFGSAQGNDESNAQLAVSVPCVVVAVDYRLAPEHPWPAAVDDGVAALTSVERRAREWGGDPDRVGVLGSSAGGAVAATVTFRWSDAGRSPLRCLVLSEPALGEHQDAPSHADRQTDAIFWTTQLSAVSWDLYLAGRTPDESSVPARRQDLTGLPPTYLDVGELDPLRDPVLDFAKRLLEQNVTCELHLWPGAFHGFGMLRGTALERHSTAALHRACRRWL